MGDHNQFTLGCNFKDFVAKVEYFPVEDTCEEGQESKSHIPSNASSIPSKAKKSCVSPFAREIIKKRCRYIKKKTDNARPKLSKYELKIKHLPPREAFYFLILPKNNEFKKGIKQVMKRSWNKEKFLSFLQELAQKSGVLVLFNERTLKRELFSLTSLLKRLLRREKIQWKEFCKMIHIFSRWDEKYKSRMESNASRMFLDMMDGNSRMGKNIQVRKAKDLRKALLSFNSESSLRKVTASTILREIRKRYCSEDSKEMIIYLVNLLLGTIGNYREFNRFKKSLKHFCAFLPFDIDYFKPRLHELKVKYRRADPYLEFYDLMI